MVFARSADTEHEVDIMKNRGMRRLLVTVIAVLIGIMALAGCSRIRGSISGSDAYDSVKNLYSYQYNYSTGTALLNIIPPRMVQDVYDNYDELRDSGDVLVPISLREYAAINTVYLDYDTNCSIVWNKNTDDVHLERTVIADREEYKQKQHRQ